MKNTEDDLQIEDDLEREDVKNEDDFKRENDLKNENNVEMKMAGKNEYDLKIQQKVEISRTPA